MIGLQGTSSAQSARQPAGASSAQSACQPVGTASAQSVIPTAYAMPQSVVLPIADTALLTARTLARYHFPEDQREQLKQQCTRLKDACSDQIRCRFAACLGKEDRLAASMTLGKGVDELQEKLQEQDMLLESYMVETLAGEALMEAYSRFHAEIHRRTGWFVKQMSFLGSSSEPIEQLPALLKMLDCNGQYTASYITCNESLCLIPKKSVVFWAELTKEGVRCAGVCDSCENVQCENRIPDNPDNQEAAEKTEGVVESIRWPDLFGRPLPYGYNRIFGR